MSLAAGFRDSRALKKIYAEVSGEFVTTWFIPISYLEHGGCSTLKNKGRAMKRRKASTPRWVFE